MASANNRLRAARAYEEAHVVSFVESCVKYRSNVTFCGFSSPNEGAKPVDTTVLLLGSETSLAQTEEVAAVFPYMQKGELEVAVKTAPIDSVYVAQITEGVRVLIGKVQATASRHNCPARPDIIHEIIKAAVKQTFSKGGLDVYYVGPADSALCIASVVARASNRSFSAKCGNAERGYLNAGMPVRVHLNSTKWPYAALEIAAASVQLCQRLTDAPTNLLDTLSFSEIAVSCVERLKIDGHDVAADIIMGEELREKGYGGLYGTGKAAEFPPVLVTLSYKPRAGISPKDRIAFVGKGIVYDTGGLSIKPRDGMVSMKHDMGGAAAIFAAFLAMVKLEMPLEISCIMCLADNAIGPCSQRNDDIVRMKSGLTVEINNTDAEGRLVLSDGIYHASAELPFTPSIIVDMATLTGAQGVATGIYHAAIYANTDASERRFVEGGRRCGDLCFPVVYCPELHNCEYKSKVADYRNSVARRSNAQVSCAAQFIGNNLASEYKGEWVHVDLASPATYDEATGYGVALLLQVFGAE
ncbi:unnamed protein product [Phytomonas sp. EM1]|nr:unnamed protein product [Phytomonas sp. EM1]|eukprot:CCW60915.1 unnamed protein product [Phytomonas sp. isolate EM1]